MLPASFLLNIICISIATGARFYEVNESETGGGEDKLVQHTHIGSYLGPELEALSRNERLLLLLQRDIRRMLRLGHLDTSTFREMFPPDFTAKGMKVTVGYNAAFGTVSATGFPLFGALVNGASTIASVAVSSMFAGDWAAEFINLQQNSNKHLLSLGGKAPTDYWEDVAMGSLWEAYYGSVLAQRQYKSAEPTIIKPVRVREDGQCSNPIEYATLEVGDLVKTPKTQTGFTENDCVEIEYVDSKTQEPKKGFVPGHTIIPQGWYEVGLGSGIMKMFRSGITIYFRSDCKPKDRTETTLEDGHFFTVTMKRRVSKSVEAWKLGDKRGWICVDRDVKKKIKGPLPMTNVNDIRDELNATLSPEANEVGNNGSADIAKASRVYNSMAASVGKNAVKGSLFVAAFFTGGATLLPLAALSVGDNAALIGFAMSDAHNIEAKVAFVVAALASFEKKMFAGETDHEPCDLSVEKQPCANGYVCMQNGVFEHVGANTGKDKGKGFCVKSPIPLLPDGSYCWQDNDCASAHCDMFSVSEDWLETKQQDKYTGKIRRRMDSTKEWLWSVLERMGGTCQPRLIEQ
eukprot:TRINITY_DN23702_c0_g2_i1.p1 TRINITY_DN23702_c0_g2~~TRINITY_DN23702_c0_g2_i1.p1  ORF type:complete len:575 (+),score=79.38 TRINITY_DN23702_c0_g2_i1:54-1778(+)